MGHRWTMPRNHLSNKQGGLPYFTIKQGEIELKVMNNKYL